MTGPPAASSSDTPPPRERWLRLLRTVALLLFWLCLLFFPQHPAAHGVLAALALLAAALAALSVLPLIGSPGEAGPRRSRPLSFLSRLWVLARDAWPYVLYVLLLTIAWLAHLTDTATQEYLRQWCFLATVLAFGQGSRGATIQWIAIAIVGLALVVVQILGPHSVLDALGRPLHYRSIQQWSGYPEIGLLASLGAAACLALALADRRWRIRIASLLLASGFVGATVFLLSRFSLITIAITGIWMACVAAIGMRSRLAMTVLAASLLAATGLLLVREDVGARVRSVFVDRTAAVEIRSEGWRVARAMMRDHPMVGVGPGNYRDEYPHYSDMGDRQHAYNLVLHEGAELGYLGLAAYLAMWARVLWRTLRAAGRSATGVAALATHGMLVAFFLRSQSEHFLANLDASFRVLLLLAVLFGLAEASPVRRERIVPSIR